MIALTAGDAALAVLPAVQIEIGRPGIDHDSVEHSSPLGTLVAVGAARRSGTLSGADAIKRLAAALEAAR